MTSKALIDKIKLIRMKEINEISEGNIKAPAAIIITILTSKVFYINASIFSIIPLGSKISKALLLISGEFLPDVRAVLMS